MARKVTTIPAIINRFTEAPINSKKKRKVAGYARVSTDHEDQISSYEAQVDYYSNYIKSRDDWEFAGIYTDEGITATSTKKRAGFNKMISDALAGKIDLIITKSVSRFARNTVDSLTNIRKLKENNIECYFEKENIWTFDSKGELLLTIMSSLAQEEVRSISENTTWGQRKSFADGKVRVPYPRFLGYTKGSDGTMVVVPEEAETIRLIYKLFLEGHSFYGVARELMKRKIKAPGGKDNWYAGTVRSILTNEKYKGDALLQKKFTVDYLTGKVKVNEGEVPQYYIEKDHEAIIDPDTFDLVQVEFAKRLKTFNKYSGAGLFSSRIKCGDCGSWYGSKIWHSADKYRRVIYQCNQKYKKDNKCSTPHITEHQIKETVVNAINQILTEKDVIIENLNLVLQYLNQDNNCKEKQKELFQEMESIAATTRNYIYENSRKVQNQDDYELRYNSMVDRYEHVKKQYDEVSSRIAEKESRMLVIEEMIDKIKENDPVEEFDDVLFSALIDYITVFSKDKRIVHFKDGTEIEL